MGVDSRACNRAPVAIVMGSTSDWACMRAAACTLDDLEVSHEDIVISAHRTPYRLVEFATHAAARGHRVIIAGAGGAAHLPGMIASMSLLPVIGVPVKSAMLNGLDSLLSIVQMPSGVPVATMAIDAAGAKNAALYAARILAPTDALLQKRLEAWRTECSNAVPFSPIPVVPPGSGS